jgi:hypothetical protein
MSKDVAEVAKIAIQVGGATGVTMMVVGGSTAALSAATLIAATGGAAALVIVGVGVYKYLDKQ